MGRLKQPEPAKTEIKVEPKPEPKPEPKLEVKPIEPPKPVTKIEPKIKVKSVGGRRWWMVGIGLGVALVGVVCFGIYAMNQNIMIGGLGVVIILGGGGLAYWGFQPQEEGIEFIMAGKKKKKITTANSLNIYPDMVAFEELPEQYLNGYPRKCRNLNKFFYVNVWDPDRQKECNANLEVEQRPKDALIKFDLPDAQYRSPGEFALNLEIPAHRRLAQRKATFLEKISPWVLVVAILIIGIVMIAKSGNGQTPTNTARPPATQDSTYQVGQ